MTIGELLVKLRFSITGEQNLSTVESRLQTAGSLADALATRLMVATTALSVMAYKALNASVALSKFQQVTGISSRDLQQWQYAAAKFGVAGDEVATTFKNIEQAQAGIALGEGNIAPWQLLNIDPRQDPRKVLLDIHDRIQGMQPAMARFVTSQMGIGEDMFVFLSQANIEYGELNKKFEASEEQNKRLMQLNGHIEQLKQEFLSLSTKILFHFEKPITDALNSLDRWIQKLSDKDIDDLAEKFLFWAKTIGYVTVALITLSSIVKAFTIGSALWKILTFFGGGAASLGGKALAEASTAAAGSGTAAAGLPVALAALTTALPVAAATYFSQKGKNAEYSGAEANKPSFHSFLTNTPGMMALAEFFGYKDTGVKSAPNMITVNVPITVNGATNPQETSKAISDHITKTLGRVNVQTPQGYGKPATVTP